MEVDMICDICQGTIDGKDAAGIVLKGIDYEFTVCQTCLLQMSLEGDNVRDNDIQVEGFD
tara:strand:+ start:968 stop:1147 length:180 start_codon:yes stop_codon:yes gene_type:complete